MALYDPARFQTEREWRRCVRVSARINSPAGWRDASILNVSSRGLMIAAPSCSDPGTMVELRGGDQLIVARVVWRKGQRAGLRADGVLPVMDIISLTEKPATKSGDRPGPVPVCRRARPRDEQHIARWPKLLELASVVGTGALIVVGMVAMSAPMIADRLGAIETALGR